MASLLIERFRDTMAKSKDLRLKSEAEFNVAYPTGFLNFDFKNGTVVHVQSATLDCKYYSVGISDGCMIMVIGRSGCGKTTWTIQAAANIVRPFPTSCIFHDDIEGGVQASRIEILTKFTPEELHNKYIRRSAGITAENFYERIKTIHDLKMSNRTDFEYDTGLYDSYGNRIFKLEPTVYIMDSLALLMPGQYTEEEQMSGQMSSTAAAKTNSMLFKRVIPMLKSANIILFIINHINQNITINPMQRTKAKVSYLKQDETLPGGNSPIYLSNIMVRFDDNSKLKASETFGIDGSMVDITFIKSRSSKAGQSVSLVFNQAVGFDPELSLFVMLKDRGKINGAGAYLYIGDRSDLKFSQRQFKQKLAEDAEFAKIFMEYVSAVLKESIEDEDPVKYAQDSNISNAILENINSDLLIA